ncbi:hypothetical protein AJ80_01148 [Polytolypa hystricis UAMH7299]|uniref:PhoD-like phosphatase metallophosphatase domain-containing protein n=1 Tax=Polytolypa hystricis (strain UAMH7299) TaxID=1447883 RepID=A0A2B7Z1J2_POLH7|nr:hypothetical protein AJ80_01148 [Polytolypa hystricis UAMH7299]
MVQFQNFIAVLTSALVRLGSYAFLRWIPGHHFPPLILTSLAVYLASVWGIVRDPEFTRAQQSSRDTPKPRAKNGSAKRKSKKGDEGGRAESQTAAILGQPSFLGSLLKGTPSARSKSATWITVGINILLGLFTLDFLFRGQLLYPTTDLALSRVGYVSSSSAKILVREPDSSKLPLHVSYQQIVPDSEYDGNLLEAGILYSLDESTDYTHPITLAGLQPATSYRYILSNNQSGEFTTSPLPGSDAANRLTFLTSSCIKPNFPYNPLSHPLRIFGIETLSEVISKLPSLSKPSFMLFLGDFIYIDVPFRFGSSISHYRNEYRRVYSSPSWHSAPEPAINTPWLHTLDDHEIANDWHAGNTTAPYPAAAEPYVHYHISVNPPIPESSFAIPSNTSYFSFTSGPASFFLLDTRAYRSAPGNDDSTMLGSAQLKSLLAYISRPGPAGVKWKIITSSVPFTKNWQVGTADTWGGFPHERRTIFDALWRAERDLGVRFILLSGDRHEFGATRFPDPLLYATSSPDAVAVAGPGKGVHEFCVGPLSMFYLPIRSYGQADDDDVAVKYLPDGNSKFGAINIDVDEKSGVSVLIYSLYIDGEVVWKYRLAVPLVPEKGRILPPGEVLYDREEEEGSALAKLERIAGDWEQRIRNSWEFGGELVNMVLGGFLRAERID